MKQASRFFAIAFILTFYQMCAQEPFCTTPVAFFIDTSEQVIDAVSSSVYAFLLQEAGATVVSSTLIKALLKTLQKTPNPFDLAKPEIQPTRWLKKKINDYFYLLLPQKDIPPKLGTYANKAFSPLEYYFGLKLDHMPTISDADFMNLAYHKTPVDEQSINKIFSSMIAHTHNGRTVSDLFILNYDYTQAGITTSKPSYSFYVLGHGSSYESMEQVIADLKKEDDPTLNDEIRRLERERAQGRQAYSAGLITGLSSTVFRNFLDFCATKITTKLLFFETCFGASVNIKQVLNDVRGQEKTYPYILASGAIENAPQEGTIAYEGTQEKLFIKKPRFDKFFEAVRQPAPIDIKQTLEYIFTPISESTTYNNILTIKYPGRKLEVFDVPHIVRIGKILASTRDPNKPLDISTFFKRRFATKKEIQDLADKSILSKLQAKDLTPQQRQRLKTLQQTTQKRKTPKIYPDAILLYATDIPFELIYSKTESKKNPPSLISLIPGDAIHSLKGISAKDFTLSRFIHSFFTIDELQSNKYFKIDRVTVTNDLKIEGLPAPGAPMTLTNFIAFNKAAPDPNKKPYQLVSFFYNGSQFVAELTAQEKKKETKKEQETGEEARFKRSKYKQEYQEEGEEWIEEECPGQIIFEEEIIEEPEEHSGACPFTLEDKTHEKEPYTKSVKKEQTLKLFSVQQKPNEAQRILTTMQKKELVMGPEAQNFLNATIVSQLKETLGSRQTPPPSQDIVAFKRAHKELQNLAHSLYELTKTRNKP